MNRGAAAACYIPIPGLAWFVARSAPRDRLVRHHAGQGGLLVATAWLLFVLLGLLLEDPGLRPVLSMVAGAVLGATLLGIATGILSAARGRYVRLRPFWDAMAVNASRARRNPRR